MVKQAESERDAQSAQPQSSPNAEALDLTSRTSPAAPLAALRPEAAFITGSTESGKQIGFEHRGELAPFGAWLGFKGVGGLGSTKGHTYDKLAEKLHGKPVGQWLTAMLRGEKLPEAAAEHAKELGELHGLLFAKEPSHGSGAQRRDLAYSFMTTELMHQPNRPEHELALAQVIGKEGIHPSAYGSAQAGAKRVTAEMTGVQSAPKEGTKIGQKYEQRRDREIATLKAWFRLHTQDLPTDKKAPTLADVEEFVRRKIREFLTRRR
ncbi:MAG: hypothetical protein QM784_22825 [Polyangiaceae bacterium]